MFENPHIIYVISKLKHEELLAESRMNRLVKSAKKASKKKISYPCKIILFIADILIKIGVSLKRRWTDIEENNGDVVLSVDNEQSRI
jgi:t-SNARE complex subunit (syntaxin)